MRSTNIFAPHRAAGARKTHAASPSRGSSRYLLRVALASASLACLGGCGSSGPEPFTLTVIAADGMGGGEPIIQNAVDRIDVIIDPAEMVRFPPEEIRFYRSMSVESRVSSAGEWVLRLRRDFLDDNAYPNGSTFAVDVPLTHGGSIADAPEPTMRVLFWRRAGDLGDQMIGQAQRFLPWPLPAGEGVDVTVRCVDGMGPQCTNTNP